MRAGDAAAAVAAARDKGALFVALVTDDSPESETMVDMWDRMQLKETTAVLLRLQLGTLEARQFLHAFPPAAPPPRAYIISTAMPENVWDVHPTSGNPQAMLRRAKAVNDLALKQLRDTRRREQTVAAAAPNDSFASSSTAPASTPTPVSVTAASSSRSSAAAAVTPVKTPGADASPDQATAAEDETAKAAAEDVRLAFRMPDGRRETHVLPRTSTLADVFHHVRTALLPQAAEDVMLFEAYPFRRLDEVAEGKATLDALGLTPRAQLLVQLPEAPAPRDDNPCSALFKAVLTVWHAVVGGGGGGASPSVPARTNPTQSDDPLHRRDTLRRRRGGASANDRDDPDRREDYNGNSTCVDSNPDA